MSNLNEKGIKSELKRHLNELGEDSSSAADGMILQTPVYRLHCSAQLGATLVLHNEGDERGARWFNLSLGREDMRARAKAELAEVSREARGLLRGGTSKLGVEQRRNLVDRLRGSMDGGRAAGLGEDDRALDEAKACEVQLVVGDMQAAAAAAGGGRTWLPMLASCGILRRWWTWGRWWRATVST